MKIFYLIDTEPSELFPVFVWFHGGGLSTGQGIKSNWCQMDSSHIIMPQVTCMGPSSSLIMTSSLSLSTIDSGPLVSLAWTRGWCLVTRSALSRQTKNSAACTEFIYILYQSIQNNTYYTVSYVILLCPGAARPEPGASLGPREYSPAWGRQGPGDNRGGECGQLVSGQWADNNNEDMS